MSREVLRSISIPSLLSRYPNDPSLLFLLNNCKTIEQLKEIHAQTLTKGLLSSHPSAILNKILYTFTLLSSVCSIDYAESVFNHIPRPSSFSYNTLIRIYVLISSPLTALQLFVKMRQQGVSPDFHTYPFALKACTKLQNRSLAPIFHSQVLKSGFCGDTFVCNTLIHAYSDMGSMVEATRLFDESPIQDAVTYNALIVGFIKTRDMDGAQRAFDKMPIRDNVSWSTLLAGFAQLNQCKAAFDLFRQMFASEEHPDDVSLVSILSACAQLGTLEQGKAVHGYIIRKGIQLTAFLSTGLVDMYSKCGSINEAVCVFESSPYKHLFTWNAMIVGLAMHGHGEKSFKYFVKMVDAGVHPDGITFLGVLVGCSHAGLVDEARGLFNKMEAFYGVFPELKHYGCMVDLLSRSGLIEEAMVLIKRMPMEADIYVWGGLLGGCRIHGNVETAEIAARHVMELDPEDGGVYSIMANIYAKVNRWKDVSEMRRLMYERRITKNVGCSLINVDGFCHEFVAGDRWHPQIREIYWVLDGSQNHHLEIECC